MSTYIISKGELTHAGIKGMRWGIRRYQNEDGTLTNLGKQRYGSAKRKVMDEARDKAYNDAVQRHLKRYPGDVNGAKAAGRQASKAATATTKVDQDKLLDDMVKKDLDATNTALRETANASRTASNAVRNTKVKVERMDLSQMSDKEMRDRIAREQLESQYDSMFNSRRHQAERGKQTVADVIDAVGTTATLASSALAIALMIKQLRGG